MLWSEDHFEPRMLSGFPYWPMSSKAVGREEKRRRRYINKSPNLSKSLQKPRVLVVL